jgi:triacylglycerol esterase/lipase EstA (alpha/beta hydrolase family)
MWAEDRTMMNRVIILGLTAAMGCTGTLPPLDPAQPSPNQPAPAGSNNGGSYGHALTPPTHQPYPIILAHGFSGFHNIGPLEYFYGVPEALRNDGRTVYVTTVDPYNDSYKRGAELLTQVQEILATSGAAKVNMLCHSQGGLDCRWVASKLGDKIGAVVTLAGVHHGTAVADIAENSLPGPVQDAVDALLNLVGATVLDSNGQPTDDAKAAIHALSSAGAAEFNAQVPDNPAVAYFSIGGRSNNASADDDCGSATEAPWLAQYDVKTDAIGTLLAATAAILNNSYKLPPTNDGLVTVASAKWGTFLGCVPSDHISEVCQIGGTGNFNCIPFFRDLARWLAESGF